MSLCRWSEDCDVYAYEHPEGQYVLEIATAKRRDTYDGLTAVAAIETLAALRMEAVRFPDSVIEELRASAKAS